jgi:hypothetical protein
MDWRIRGNYYQCKKQLSAKHREWKHGNPDKYKDYAATYYQNNRAKVIQANYRYASNRKKEDTEYTLAIVLRQRLNKALRGQYKVGSAVKDLGCSVAEFKEHLESKFMVGMSWDNYGKSGWHIDHIRPLSSFNLSDPEQFKAAAHFTNMQPLWASDNCRKSNKWSA